MNAMLLQALQYVKNTNGGATKSHFIEDHEPVGDRLWNDLNGFAPPLTVQEKKQ